jgi:beta-lactamase class D
VVLSALAAFAAAALAAPPATDGACFLLYQQGRGVVRRSPSEACRVRVSPQSTFKIPHALAALDAGVISGPRHVLRYDGARVPFESWRRDHDLASALPNSVLWYFQRVAETLGMQRERAYLERFDYGNRDARSALTSFWVGGSLAVSPEEQLRFLIRLFTGALPVKREVMESVRRLLVQPPGRVVNARGEHPFADPWPPGTVVAAKTGSGNDRSGRQVRWLVGQVARGGRAWVFVSCVIGDARLAPLAAVELAARALREEGVL